MLFLFTLWILSSFIPNSCIHLQHSGLPMHKIKGHMIPSSCYICAFLLGLLFCLLFPGFFLQSWWKLYFSSETVVFSFGFQSGKWQGRVQDRWWNASQVFKFYWQGDSSHVFSQWGIIFTLTFLGNTFIWRYIYAIREEAKPGTFLQNRVDEAIRCSVGSKPDEAWPNSCYLDNGWINLSFFQQFGIVFLQNTQNTLHYGHEEICRKRNARFSILIDLEV